MDAGELPAGTTTTFTTDVELRPGTAPTHDLDPAHTHAHFPDAHHRHSH